MTGYYGLFDLGIRSSIVRYVAKYSATGESEQLNRLVNTAMFSYSAIGASGCALRPHVPSGDVEAAPDLPEPAQDDAFSGERTTANCRPQPENIRPHQHAGRGDFCRP